MANCVKCAKLLTLEESNLSKGKYCFEHAARAYKFAMIKQFGEIEELESIISKKNQKIDQLESQLKSKPILEKLQILDVSATSPTVLEVNQKVKHS